MKITSGLMFIIAALFITGCCCIDVEDLEDFDIEDFEDLDMGYDSYDGSGGYYACSYETRHSGCGGKDWSAWESECFEFNRFDYTEGWTPERVCNKYTGSDTNCGGSCCIYIQYRNNQLSPGRCP